MKVTNWRRKLALSLVAGGTLTPAATQAANLDTNLVLNPGFESVDLGITGDYNAPAINDWLGGPGFAYSHQPGITGVPDYADGADPPNAGNWYFTANNNPGSATGDFRAPDQVYQDIPVNSGATGTQIATGEAALRLSAYMSSYLNDSDSGNVQVDFKNAGGTTIGSAIISDPDFGPDNVWSLTSYSALIPAATASLRVSIYGTPRNSGADGYIDNVDVQITNAANVFVFLEVNTTNGQVRMRNQTGDPVNIDYYEIASATGALNADTWNSLQEQNLPGFPAGNGSGNGWEQAGGSNSNIISESYLTGSSSVNNGATVNLGAAFTVGGAQNLVFKYGALQGPVVNPTGDYNNDGTVDAADYVVWRNNNINGQQGYTDWRANFGQTAGVGGTSTLLTGFVRYVTSFSGASLAAVPEPTGVLYAGIGWGLFALAGRRRNTAA